MPKTRSLDSLVVLVFISKKSLVFVLFNFETTTKLESTGKNDNPLKVFMSSGFKGDLEASLKSELSDVWNSDSVVEKRLPSLQLNKTKKTQNTAVNLKFRFKIGHVLGVDQKQYLKEWFVF